MNPWRPACLAEAARAEHGRRAARGPALVGEGRAERSDVEADIAAWDAIARLFEAGSAETPLPWASLVLAAARGLQALSDAADRAPGDPVRAARRDAVHAIHDRLAWHAVHFGPLADLYAAAAGRVAA